MKAFPDRCELLWRLRGEIDDAMLQEMAFSYYDDGCAYGDLRMLREVFKLGAIPFPFSPDAEICELHSATGTTINFTQPLNPKERREQLMRLFAGWILLNAWATPDSYGSADNQADVLRAFTESSIALGPAYIPAAAQFVAWALAEGKAGRDPSEHLYYLLGLLILRSASPDQDDLAGTLAVYDELVAIERSLHPIPPDDPYTAALPDSSGAETDVYQRLACGTTPMDPWMPLAAWSLDRLLTLNSTSLNPKFAEFKRRMLSPVKPSDGEKY